MKQDSHELGERIKGLSCLYGLEKISRTENITNQNLLKKAVRLLPPGWQCPGITGGCITFEGKAYKTKNFRRTKWMQRADIIINNKKKGAVQVCYLGKKPDMDEGPFLKEERHLIDAVASRIGQIIENKRKEEELEDSEQRLRILFEYAPDAYYLHDFKGNLIDGNRAAEKITGYKREELIGRNFLKLGLLDAQDSKKASFLLAKNIQRKATEPEEFSLRRKDGTRVPVEIKGYPVRIKGESVVLGIARDISRSKKAEEALRESEEKYKAIVESASDFIFSIDRNNRVLSVNKAAVCLFEKKPKDIIGTSIYKLFPRNIAQKYSKNLKEVFKSGKPVFHESIMMVDGRKYWLSVSLSPVKGNRGKVISVIGVAHDISHQKEAEERLKIERAYIDQLFESAQEAIVMADQNGGVMRVNKAFEELFGFSFEEVKGKQVDEIIAPEDEREIARSITKRVAMGDNVSLETMRQKKGGSLIDVSVLASPIEFDGNLLGIYGIYRDISERKRAAEALRESEARYRALFESSVEGILIADIKTKMFMYANPALCKMFGYSEKELKRMGVKDIHRPEDLGFVISEFEAQAKGEKTLAKAVPCVRKDGTIFYADISTAMMVIDGKKCNVGLFRDVTQRLKTEQKLKASLKEKEVLLKEIHHRVKNNLQVISSLLTLQTKHIKGEKNIELFKESQNRVKSMALIHEKLYQSRDLASVNFKEYLHTLVIGLFRSYQALSARIELKLNVEDVSLGIDCAIPCGLIINELVSNSLKYAFPNGRQGEISVVLRPSDKQDVELVVSDNGIGIPDEVDFRNTDSLGLHLVTVLAEDQLDGEIELSRDKGTEFRIKLKGVR